MIRRFGLATMLIATLLLAGCITLDITNDIRPDGSGFKIFITGIDKEMLEGLEDMAGTPEPGQEGLQTEDMFADTCDQALEIPGATCEPYEDDDTTGIKVTAPFANLDGLAALSDYELFNADSVSYEQSGNTTTLYFTLNLGDVSEGVAAGSGEMEMPEGEATLTPEEEEMAQQMMEMMDIKFYYRAIVPGNIVDYSPKDNATIEGNQITWEIDLLSEQENLELMVQYGGAAPPQPEATQPSVIQPEATQPPADETPVISPGGGEEEGGASTSSIPCCGSCLPGLILPAGAAGSALVLRKKRSPRI